MILAIQKTWLVIACSWALLLQAAEAKDTVSVGYTIEGVGMNVGITRKNVEAATEILLREMLRERTDLTPDFRLFETSADLIVALVAGEIDFVEIHPLVFFRLPTEVREKVRPSLLVQFGETRLENFVLLGRPGSSIEGARGTVCRIYNGRDRGIGQLWLNSVLSDAGLPVPAEHFGEIETFSKAEQVLLPTFFGKAEFCVAVEGDYKTAIELNPQIAKQLVPLARSEGVPFVIAGATDAVSEELGRSLNDEIAPSVKFDPGGRQALALLGVNRLGRIREGDLDALEKIILKVDSLRADRLTADVKRGEP